MMLVLEESLANASQILSTVFVIGRLWIRFRITHTPGIDDLFVTLAMVCLSGTIAY